MNCAICNVEMKEYDRHMPAPLLMDEEDQVCGECNHFVTASRMHLSKCDPLDKVILGGIFSEILKMAFALKNANEQLIKMLQEEEE